MADRKDLAIDPEAYEEQTDWSPTSAALQQQVLNPKGTVEANLDERIEQAHKDSTADKKKK